MELLKNIAENMGTFLAAHTLLSYAVLFFGSYFETLIGVGFFIYGEIFFIPGALLAGAGVLNIWLVAFALIVGGILGDSTSFALGRRWGTSIFKEDNKIFNHTNYQKGLDFFAKYGTKAVFFARLLGPVSWITPFLAGTYKVPYPRFLGYNVAGVTVGIGQFLIIGYFFGSNFNAILSSVKQDAAVVGGITVLVAAVYYIIKRNKG
ncbi:MAG: DedA family protein [Patescibacteria group bacterium]